ncbi:MAG: hypothetical protein HYU52_11535 [Acidobacteria bacterium]|nr:hypothetical protein [Acidobacteriota bacterium]
MEIDGFGYKNMWFAVKNGEAEEIIRALGLEPGGKCAWSEGLEAAYEFGSGKVFVTPRLDGWTICVGTGLFPFEERDRFVEETTKLAVALGTEVQFFATHRVVEAHAWARATPNGLVRAYRFVGERGETSTDIGAETTEERELGFRFFDERSQDARQDGYWDRTDLSFPNEESVMLLAGKWSVDPTKLDGREVGDGVGMLATVPGGEKSVSHPSPLNSSRPWWKFW